MGKTLKDARSQNVETNERSEPIVKAFKWKVQQAEEWMKC